MLATNRYAFPGLDRVCRQAGVSFVRSTEAKGLKEATSYKPGATSQELEEDRSSKPGARKSELEARSWRLDEIRVIG